MATKTFTKKVVSEYIKSNNSFSGCDMVATVTMTIGKKQISRIIGELQTITYSTHMSKAPVRSIGNVNAKDYVYGPRTIAGSLIFAVFDQHFAYHTFVSELKSHNKTNKLFNVIMDEMPPFDVTISFTNEFGHRARLAIYGIRIVDEGMAMSVNDVYTENTYQFVATDIDYMTKIESYSSSSGAKSYYNATTGKVVSSEENNFKNIHAVGGTSVVESTKGNIAPKKINVLNKTANNVINISKG